MVNTEQMQKILNLLPELGSTIKDYEILVDGNSVGLVTSKLNAFISVMMKDQPESVKDEFRAAWKAEYRQLATSKVEKSIAMLENDKVWEALDITDAEMIVELRSEAIPTLKALLEQMEDAIVRMENLIDKAEV